MLESLSSATVDSDVVPEQVPHASRWWILAVVGLAQLMVVLDATVVNIALPSAQKALHFSNIDRQWIVTGYALAFGSLLLLGGRIADLFGRKRTFIVGLAGFAIASAVGGASTGFIMLVTSRAVQGIFGALLAPAALSLLTTTFADPKERGKAFGIFGAIAGAGGAIGLLLGGILTEYLSWRWSLYVNLVFAILAIVGGAIFLKDTERAVRPQLDIPGVATASAAVFSLVYGFSHAATSGWSSPITVAFLAAGTLLLGVFVLIESKVKAPLLPMRIVLDRNRGGSYLAVFVASAGMFGVFLFLTYYLQASRGYSPVTTGLAFLPMIGTLVITATLATAKALPIFGPRPLVSSGMAIAGVAMELLTRLGLHTGYGGTILPALLLLGVGLGLVMAPSMNTATANVTPGDAGVASAMVNTSQQVGGSIGTALLNTLAATAGTTFLLHKVPTQILIAQATVHSYTSAFSFAGIIFFVGAAATVFLLKGRPTRLEPTRTQSAVHL